jgi:hypothetical protein
MVDERCVFENYRYNRTAKDVSDGCKKLYGPSPQPPPSYGSDGRKRDVFIRIIATATIVKWVLIVERRCVFRK